MLGHFNENFCSKATHGAIFILPAWDEEVAKLTELARIQWKSMAAFR